jgi:hypothetical protein
MNYDKMRELAENAADFAAENNDVVALTLTADKDSGEITLSVVDGCGRELSYGWHRRFD